MGPVNAFRPHGGEDMDAQLLLVGVAVASASAVVLRIAWRGRPRTAIVRSLPAANMVAQPVTILADMGWLLRMDPEMAYALLELGRALDQAAVAADSRTLSAGVPRVTGPPIVRGVALRAMMDARPAGRATAVPEGPRPTPDALRMYLEQMGTETPESRTDAFLADVLGAR